MSILKSLSRLVVVSALAASVVPAGAVAGPRRPQDSAGIVAEFADAGTQDLLVRFRADTPKRAKAAAHAAAGAQVVREFDIVPGLVHVRPGRGMSAEVALRAYSKRPDVLYAEPDGKVQAFSTVPNDPRFGELWGLENTGQTGGVADADIDATLAWDDTTGSPDVVVAVIDTGIDYRHEDLDGNVWVNPAEIPGNGIDDDSSGYVDDIHGADLVSNDGDPLDLAWDNHGTHVAGTIGAEGDNSAGVVGVNHDVSIMSVRVLDPTGNGLISNIVAGIQYADRMGADVLNLSLGWTTYNQACYDAIAAFGGLTVCAAGNNGRDNDVTATYPASYALGNVLAVGATTDDDVRASYSNWGAASVDVFAPGDAVLSTVGRWDQVFLDDMSSLAGWDTSRYVTKPWSLTSSWSVSPPSSAAHMGYANSESSYLVQTGTVDLRGYDYARLSFDLWLHTELYYDFVRVYASEDDVITDADYLGRFHGGGAAWYYDRGVDLSKFAGKQVHLAFELRSDTSNTLSGAMIDDVTVLAGNGASAYTTLDGTSMASPHAAGVAALLLAEKPDLTGAQLRGLIMDGADPVPALAGLCASGGRLNAAGARDLLGDVEPPVTTVAGLPTGAGPVSLTLSATDDRSGVAWTRYSLDGAAEVDGTALAVTTPGSHTLSFRSADVSGNVETAHVVTFDVMRRVEQTATALSWVRTWSSLARAAYSGGTQAYASATGSAVSVTFDGTGIDWIGTRSTSAGKARVYVDGALAGVVDLYAGPNINKQVLFSRRGLAPGGHVLRIEATGTRNLKSTGYNIWVDAFDVCGDVVGP